MEISKEDVLAALKKEGINNLDDLAKAAAKAKAGLKTDQTFLVTHNFAVSNP